MAASPQATSNGADAQNGSGSTSLGSSSLYVGDLEAHVTEAQLYELFSTVGPVVSIRVCRDIVSRTSLGYGYVNFQQAQDASKAIDVLNFTTMNGKAIRISYSQRDPSARKSGVGNILVKNLDAEIDNKTLHDTFARFGRIISAKVAEDQSGSSRGFGYVQFETADEAKSAISNVDGMELANKTVSVTDHQRRSDRGDRFTNIFIKNISPDTSEDDLHSIFGKYGNITSAVMKSDGEPRSTKFAFVNFDSADAASQAVSNEHARSEDGYDWFVDRHKKRPERNMELQQKLQEQRKRFDGCNLYVRNLSDSVDDDKLRTLFGDFGTIASCKIQRDSHGVSRGVGFVAFNTSEEAMRAVTDMNNHIVDSKPLYVAPHQPKDERNKAMQAQAAQRSMIGGPASMPTSMPMMTPQQASQLYGTGQAPPPLVASNQSMPSQAMSSMNPAMNPGQRPGGQMYPAAMMQGRGRGRGRAGGRGRGGPQAGPNGPQLRYQPGARNVDGNMNGAQATGGSAAEGVLRASVGSEGSEGERSLDIGSLAQELSATSSDEEARNLLGESLFPQVLARTDETTAPKITGMLLNLGHSEVLNLLETPEMLNQTVRDAQMQLQGTDGASNDE